MFRRSCAALLAALALSALVLSPASAATNPLAGRSFYRYPSTSAAAALTTYPATASYVKKISDTPQAMWLTVPGSPTNIVAGRVSSIVGTAKTANQEPVFVLYAIPHRDCGSYSAGGLASRADYAAWIKQVVVGIAGRPAAVIIEPDALTSADCLTSALRTERYAMIKDAVYQLAASTNTAVYIDGGHSQWLSVDTLASRLSAVGISKARGFSLNIAGTLANATEQAYGEKVSAALTTSYGQPAKYYVVDTSRNGLGPPPPAALNWCNPAGRALGAKPTSTTTAAHADAYLWIKHPGESDGSCRSGEPGSGVWWNDYAVGLVKRSGY
jgi:endoglucanase